MSTEADPLTADEERAFREGLRSAPSINHRYGPDPVTLHGISNAEWADRCRQLLATLDAERAARMPMIAEDPTVIDRQVAAAEDTHDARRYRRLRILGAAPGGSRHLDNGTVITFTGLDEFLDEDLRRTPSRGEAR